MANWQTFKFQKKLQIIQIARKVTVEHKIEFSKRAALKDGYSESESCVSLSICVWAQLIQT